jgi:regulator of protease activity HflC (stomatin/prohibitin superfamily)
MITALIAVLIVLVLLIAIIGRAVKIIKEYQRIIVFRLGRAIGAKGPGLTIINPVIDRINYVDLREQYFEIPHQTAITKDNAPISIDFIMFYQVIDPVQSVVAVQDFKGAALNVAATTLRSVVGDMSLDDVLSRREDMNALLRVRLDEVTERWGVKVSNVEVREINPPPGVQEAMTRQMSAERTRRAVVTESEGQKQAAVTVAEGQKQAAVLAAEGQKQATILSAEADREAAKLRAQGLADALEAMLEAAARADANVMTLQYLETLKALAESPSTTFVLPTELTGLVANISRAAKNVMDLTNPEIVATNGTSH